MLGLGSLVKCWKFDVSLSSSRAAMAVTAEERAIPVFEGRKVKGGGKKRRRESIRRCDTSMLAAINLVHVTLILDI